MMKRSVIGILAHVDAGKTTLSEAMLYTAGSLRILGRVDHGDAFLDTFSLERQRGITIFSKQAVLRLPELQATLLDTPGHVDFSAEMERTLDVLDCAILVVSGSSGRAEPYSDGMEAAPAAKYSYPAVCQQDGSARNKSCRGTKGSAAAAQRQDLHPARRRSGGACLVR